MTLLMKLYPAVRRPKTERSPNRRVRAVRVQVYAALLLNNAIPRIAMIIIISISGSRRESCEKCEFSRSRFYAIYLSTRVSKRSRDAFFSNFPSFEEYSFSRRTQQLQTRSRNTADRSRTGSSFARWLSDDKNV